MPKMDPIGVRLDPDVRAALTRAAQADARSISSLAQKVLAEWLRRGGWLRGEGAAAAKPKPKPKPLARAGR